MISTRWRVISNRGIEHLHTEFDISHVTECKDNSTELIDQLYRKDTRNKMKIHT